MKEKIMKNEILYYIAFFLLAFTSISKISLFFKLDNITYKIFYIIILTIFLIKFLISKYSKKMFLTVIGIGIIALYLSLVTKNFLFILDYMAIASIKDVNIKNVIKIDLTIKLLFLLIHVALYTNDYFFNYYKIANKLIYTFYSGKSRYAFYFTHANSANSVVICSIIDWIIISTNKKKSIIIGTIIAFIFSKLTISRTSEYIYYLYLLTILFLSKGWFKKVFYLLEKYLFLGLSIISFVILKGAEFISKKFFIDFNVLFSYRFSLGILAIEKYGIHFLTHKINDSVLDISLIVDNFYIRSFIEYGIILLILITFLYFIVSKIKEKNIYHRAMFIIFPIYLFTELFPFNVGRAIFLLIIANSIINKSDERRESIK